MGQILTVACKLEVPADLRAAIDATLAGYADACNQILDVARAETCQNTTKLHHLTYYAVREATKLKANHIFQAIRRVIGALHTKKEVHKFRPGSLNLDIRTFEYREAKQAVGITLKDRRVWLPLQIGNYQRALLAGQTPTSATLCKRQDGRYYIHIQVELATPPTGKTPKVIGVDLGRRAIATTSTGRDWDGGQLQATRDTFFRTRRSVQRKRSRQGRRLLRRLSGRERRFQTWVNHNISKQLVAEAKAAVAALALEDLTGIRERTNEQPRNRRERRRSNSWAFYQLRQFLTYKAAVAGVSLVLVPPHYTSQGCHHCLHMGTRREKAFACAHCDWQGDADFNGACNIAHLGAVFVNQPEVSTLVCWLEHVSSLNLGQGQSSLQTA